MTALQPAQVRGLALLLAILGAGALWLLLARGSPREEGFVIRGDPAAAMPASALLVPDGRSTAKAAIGSRAGLASQPGQAPPSIVVVHVAGAVKKPGVYRLAAGARADDALKAAGGSKPGADLDAINLAARVEDGTQLYVPARAPASAGAGTAFSAAPAIESSLYASANHPANSPRAATSSASADGRQAAAKLSRPGKETININTSPPADLERLPGVGPAIAARIIEYRKQTGAFSQKEQLMDVPGIGEKKFAKIEPFIRLR